MENFNKKENQLNSNSMNNKNKIIDDFISENISQAHSKKGINNLFSVLLLILSSIFLFFGISSFMGGILLLFYDEYTVLNPFIIIITLIIIGYFFWSIKITQLQDKKIHYNLFLLFLIFIGWQMLIFYIILIDIGHIIENGWGYGYFLKTGAGIIIGIILTIINIPILSLIYNKSGGLK